MVSQIPADAPVSPGSLRPFGLPNRFRGRLGRGAFHLARPAIEKVLGLSTLNGMYANHTIPENVFFADFALDMLNVSYHVEQADWARIPAAGPIIVVSNHPFGGLDGLVLLSLLRRVRTDLKFLANFLLRSLPDLHDSLLFVDPFGGTESAGRNVAVLRSAIRHVRDGGMLGMFPAGEVAHARLTSPRRVVDPEWSGTLARIVRSTQAPVLPVFVEGANSLLFQLAGMIHPRLRTLMLPRELLRQRNARIVVRIGNVLSREKLARFEDPEEMTAYVRVRTYILKGRSFDENDVFADSRTIEKKRLDSPIDPPPPHDHMCGEIASLPSERRLASSGNLDVLIASAQEIPSLMQEIGRQREIAFRRVGEGTGRSIDLDRFDQFYLHLFAWDRQTHRLAGAYRIGATDEILPRYGIGGLYTRTLFRFGTRLIAQLDPALELGRSFVCVEYQRNYAPLMVLWKGIGQYVARHPRYRMLFGPVSISNEYHSISKQLLMAFLSENRYLPALARFIHPRRPPRMPPIRDWDPRMTGRVVQDIHEVDELISEIEADRLGVPVLLRQYLKLDARLLGFNVDPRFGDVVDGLMLVDVTRINRTTLDRYLGREHADAYIAYHRQHASAS